MESSKKNIADLSALLELRDSVSSTNSKVDKVNEMVGGLDTKLNIVVESISKIKGVAPFELDCANQLDQLISFLLICTLEEENESYKDNLDHHLFTINTMLKIHDDMIFATNKLIKQTHDCHEIQTQRLEKEIIHKDAMNMVM